MRNNTQKESVMDKFKRYDIELGDDGFWNRCLVVDESYNGDWVRYSEVRDEIEKLEKQNQMMLDALKELCNGKWGCPCELSNEELVAWDKARTSITNVEGQQ
jgi:hypothetical protein